MICCVVGIKPFSKLCSCNKFSLLLKSSSDEPSMLGDCGGAKQNEDWWSVYLHCMLRLSRTSAHQNGGEERCKTVDCISLFCVFSSTDLCVSCGQHTINFAFSNYFRIVLEKSRFIQIVIEKSRFIQTTKYFVMFNIKTNLHGSKEKATREAPISTTLCAFIRTDGDDIISK